MFHLLIKINPIVWPGLDVKCSPLTFDVNLDPPADSGGVAVAGDTEVTARLLLPDLVQLQHRAVHTGL